MKSRTSALLGQLAVLLLATQPGCEQGSGEAAGCDNECERGQWPRVILAVAGARAGEVTLSAMGVDGREFIVYPGGCPELPSRWICSYSVLLGTAEQAELVVSLGDGEMLRHIVTTAPYNTCGRDITYQRIEVGENDISFLSPQSISPCEAQWAAE